MPDLSTFDHPVLPLDLAILDKLPEEGTMLGYHHLGKQVSKLKAELSEESPIPVTSDEVSTRLRVMRLNGLTAYKHGGSRSLLWQRTPLGKEVVEQEGVPTPGPAAPEG